ncbi:MAG: HEAT repeat domain-containing protein [Planctomycetes bacterium]|nr:HEAT repeat domain-containing protein [Planctomycetota bacterium]
MTRAFAGLALLLASTCLAEEAVDVSGLVSRLGSADAVERCNAAKELEKLGPKAAEAMPALVKALGDSNEGVRRAALHAIADVSGDDPGTAAELMTSSDPERRRQAVAILGMMRSASRKALPALVKALDDPEARVRVAAAQAVVGIGLPAVPSILDAFRTSRNGAGNLYVAIRQSCNPVFVRPFVDALVAEEESDIRPQVSSALLQLLAAAREEIVREMASNDPARRQAVARLLGTRPDLSARHVMTVFQDVPALRPAILDSMERLRVPAAEAVGPLLAGLGEGDAALRARVIELVGAMDPGRAEVQSAVDAGLADADAGVRAAAAFAGVKHDPDRGRAVPRAVRGLADADRGVRLATLRAMAPHLAGDRMLLPRDFAAHLLPGMEAALRGTDPEGRHIAAGALARLRPLERSSLPILMQAAAKDPDAAVRAAAAFALPGAPPGNARGEALDILLDACAEKHPDVRAAACTALATWAPAGTEVARIGERLFEAGNATFRAAAARALGNAAAADAEKARLALKEAAGDDDGEVRGAVAEAMKRLGR